jgi:hypothetical protein
MVFLSPCSKCRHSWPSSNCSTTASLQVHFKLTFTNNPDCLSTFETPGANISVFDLKVLSEILIKSLCWNSYLGANSNSVLQIQQYMKSWARELAWTWGKYSVFHSRQILIRGAAHSIQLHFEFHLQTSVAWDGLEMGAYKGRSGRVVNRKTRGMLQKSEIELVCIRETRSFVLSLWSKERLQAIRINRLIRALSCDIYMVYFSLTKEIHLNSCPFRFYNSLSPSLHSSRLSCLSMKGKFACQLQLSSCKLETLPTVPGLRKQVSSLSHYMILSSCKQKRELCTIYSLQKQCLKLFTFCDLSGVTAGTGDQWTATCDVPTGLRHAFALL